jgi:hypothetical protein
MYFVVVAIFAAWACREDIINWVVGWMSVHEILSHPALESRCDSQVRHSICGEYVWLCPD